MKTIATIIAIMLLTSLGQQPQVTPEGRGTGSGEPAQNRMTAADMGPQSQVTVKGKVTDFNDLPLSGVKVTVRETNNSTQTASDGTYIITPGAGAKTLVFSLKGMKPLEEPIAGRTVINVRMEAEKPSRQETKDKKPVADQVMIYEQEYVISESADAVSRESRAAYPATYPSTYHTAGYAKASWNQPQSRPDLNTESYAGLAENGYMDPLRDPYSTFSIDVDNASYSNVRRFINLGQKVPADAVRVEEMINYFKYDYPKATGEHPFSVYTETGICPWNKSHYLLHIGLRGKEIDKEELPPSNLVFLIDVSGSMNYPNKLPLLKSAFGMLVNELRAQDRVAIVVYAGAAGVVLESTPGNNRAAIMQALENLQAGGSTAGGEGIRLAYKIAERNFIKGGNNRIILATDGDFNVGVSDNASMEKLVEEKRGLGVYMTVLGFGMGNIKDDKMEIIADKGNGNYAYIDNIQEARRVLVKEFGGTLFTIAKDVKFQVEFNPAYVKSYRLVGYENRILADEDFNDDTKDAGEMGAGHTVTALYEIVPAGSDETGFPTVDPLRYQRNRGGVTTDESARDYGDAPDAGKSIGARDGRAMQNEYPRELCNIKLRYKDPEALNSKMFSKTVSPDIKKAGETTDRYRFSAAVAAFGMILRDSKYRGTASISDVITLASGARGTDPDGYRAEFIRLVESTK